MDIAGRPMIEHVVERAKAIHGIDQVALNVPVTDVELADRPYAVGVKDQEKDVLGSYLYLAEELMADVIIRITGDCPLLCPLLCNHVLNLYKSLNDKWVYCANDTLRSGFPDGTDCEVFSTLALRKAAQSVRTAFEREHVTVWLRRELPNYGVLAPYEWEDDQLKDAKWSVDTEADLIMVRGIYGYLAQGQFSVTETAFAYRVMLQDLAAAQERN
jgi:spore coat polysaccharide biosynthesis protein SpsF (cytidylyltransferase family)